MGYIGFAKPVLMKANPIGLHRIGKVTQLGYIAKPVLMKANPIGLHRICKACTYES